MLVEVPVSSDKNQVRRIKQPLARLSDGAGHGHVGPILLGRVNAFFEADAVSVVEAPHGCDADRDAALAQQSPDFFKRDVRMCPSVIAISESRRTNPELEKPSRESPRESDQSKKTLAVC
jgi:hypothetical protein